MRLPLIAVALAAPAIPAVAQVEMVIGAVGGADADGRVAVDLRLLNDADTVQEMHLPDRVEARLESASGADRTLWLVRDDATPARKTLPAGGFARARYRFEARESDLAAGVLSVPAWSAQRIAFNLAPPPIETPPQVEPTDSPPWMTPAEERRTGHGFLDNLSSYEPVYAVYGPDTHSAARLQFSFKYQLLGHRSDKRPSWMNGLHFAYTQRMFWDLEEDSSPFRNIDYQPELLYITPAVTLGNDIHLNAQLGWRHESNGRAGDQSRSLNSLYVAPMAALPLGGGYTLTVAPRLSFLVGSKKDNPDIRQYRGHTALVAGIGKERSWQLATTTRFDVDSGKGSLNAELSYPLTGILHMLPDLYLFGQSFFGYGENLLDYNRSITRFRIGIGAIR